MQSTGLKIISLRWPLMSKWNCWFVILRHGPACELILKLVPQYHFLRQIPTECTMGTCFSQGASVFNRGVADQESCCIVKLLNWRRDLQQCAYRPSLVATWTCKASPVRACCTDLESCAFNLVSTWETTSSIALDPGPCHQRRVGRLLPQPYYRRWVELSHFTRRAHSIKISYPIFCLGTSFTGSNHKCYHWYTTIVRPELHCSVH